ncbi:hypothetical protein NDU88_004465 [Pleurodeles waltl]|uniref:Uncharacterized protein n=1 Tax=Pleurodeles waltl TaxID=8319 RepID=A0AAV7VGC1_PLEWA|nr:hypothetical protein NDU88_004465 [Pleurodeles waltl]
MTVLEKGLSFVPTTKPHFFETKIELQRFFRRIRLSNFYRDKPRQSPCTTTVFRPPSSFTPPSNAMPVEILTFEKMVLKDVETLSKGRDYTRFNLTYEENMALQDLKQRRDVVIKAADKGGGIVLQDIDNYKREIRRQLSDQDCYKARANAVLKKAGINTSGPQMFVEPAQFPVKELRFAIQHHLYLLLHSPIQDDVEILHGFEVDRTSS